ncbi:efflux RND transporter permease subunit [Solirubrobacter ginsenosidimutans]|uniref:Efflux RND transporter permease subunit n=1 Tax=Solirubrobacter ginsenosidimutans TaxID=490573 RepID=A0A9X3MPT1_9ACTN|nr:efflux RND transporter permease subunit [Solirubrobacter ginsenosidimutans]MDA0160444.1 efflux RND transporter permease subunit [Solirubrobacter ginsenosidimutans]
MRWIIGISLRFRLLVLVVAAGVLAFGVTRLHDAPVDVLGEFTPPYVEIQTEALGLSANEVEQLITVPLEADLLNGVAGVDTIRSESVPGLSSIVMVFRPGTDIYKGRALVQERLTQAHALPNVSKPPLMLQPKSSSSRVLMIGLSNGAKNLSPIEQGILARWTIRPRLLGVPGVANVAIWGQREQQLQVQVDPRRLRSKHVTLDQIIATTGNAQLVSPLTFLEASTPGTGGFIETPNQRLQVRHVFDRLSTPAALASVPLEDSRPNLSLGDVATISEDHQPLIGDAVVADGSGLMLVVEKLPGANTLAVTRAVEDALEELRPGLAGMKTDTNVFRPASVVSDAISNLTLAIIIGAGLLVLVLAALVMRWRTVLTSLVALSLSLVTAALVIELLGETFNAISFAGLAAALAIVIGDAVMGAESIARRLRAGYPDGERPSIRSQVLQATTALRRPLVYALLIALIAVLPLVVMQGRPGAFFSPIAVAYVAAVLASTLVALTVTPALSTVLAGRAPRGGREPAVLRRLAALHSAALARVVGRPRAMLAAVGGCAVAALAALALLDPSVVPSFKDRDLLVQLDAKPGTAQPVMTQLATDATSKLEAIDGVRDVGAHLGRAVTGDQVVDVNSSELWVNLDRDADYDKTIAQVRRTVAGLRAVKGSVIPYTEQKIRDVGTLISGGQAGEPGALNELTGTRKPLVVRVFGEDLETLRATAEKVRGVVAGVDGVADPKVELAPTEPTIEIETKLDAARARGIKPGDVRRAEAALLQGIQVGSIFGKQKVFDVVVQGVPSTRTSVESVRDLLIDGPRGTFVRLGDVATVSVKQAPAAIERDAVSRRIDVVADVRGRSESAVQAEVEARLAAMQFPLQYHAEVLKDSTSSEIRTPAIVATAIAVLIAMFLILQAALRSWRVAALTFLTLPAALAGGVLVAIVDGATLSLGAALGLLGTLAIAVRGALLIVSRFQELEDEAACEPGPDLVRRGAREQFGALVAAALATAAFLVPFVVLGSPVGLEIVHPMATVLLGGLLTATLMTLFALPTLYARFAAGTGRDPADGLLHRWAGAEPAPAPTPTAVRVTATAEGS